MAHLWIDNPPTGWEELQLDGDQQVQLNHNPPLLTKSDRTGGRLTPTIRTAATSTASESIWVLLAGQADGVWVNDAPLVLGIRRLVDRDEIRVPGAGTIFFSTESLAQVKAHEGSPVTCPRCRTVIESGSPSVRCPSCGVSHHQSEEFPCWTYAHSCVLCPQATNLEVDDRFCPEDL
ncbi:MAG: hypothetical protein GY906_08155 [bacterium]|nr:hypothetical protein [bacterium]